MCGVRNLWASWPGIFTTSGTFDIRCGRAIRCVAAGGIRGRDSTYLSHAAHRRCLCAECGPCAPAGSESSRPHTLSASGADAGSETAVTRCVAAAGSTGDRSPRRTAGPRHSRRRRERPAEQRRPVTSAISGRISASTHIPFRSRCSVPAWTRRSSCTAHTGRYAPAVHSPLPHDAAHRRHDGQQDDRVDGRARAPVEQRRHPASRSRRSRRSLSRCSSGSGQHQQTCRVHRRYADSDTQDRGGIHCCHGPGLSIVRGAQRGRDLHDDLRDRTDAQTEQ